MAKLLTILILLLVISTSLTAQTETNLENLKSLKEKYGKRYIQAKAKAIEWATKNNIPLRKVYENGTVIELQRIENNIPIYYTTHNANAAATSSADKIWVGGSTGLDLDGSGVVVGEWDGGAVLPNHQELNGRVTQEDSPSGTSDHATHVAGTMLATGVDAAARGMASAATLRAWDYNDDITEMSAAASSLLLSNHSYGIVCGWDGIGLQWRGDATINNDEDYKFGYYGDDSKDYDDIAYNAPYYLIVFAAGNDRTDGPLFGNAHPADYENDGGYDTLPPGQVAKNIITVAAVEDLTTGYSQASDVVMSSFSSWGPTDDGRIKPDLSANGVSLYSSSHSGAASYTTMSGTSMASPNTTGSLILLRQHYQNLFTGANMRSATLKALAIHTADEAGAHPGPDYSFGWGLVNVEKAANLLSSFKLNQDEHTLQENVLNNGASHSFNVTSDGSGPIRVTIAWTDPAGTPISPVTQIDQPDLMLVNDLDMRVTGNGNTYQPWILNPASFSAAATTGDNFRDNVEQILINTPAAGTYTVTINHKGALTNGSQAFSLVLSGAKYVDDPLPVELSSFNAAQVNDKIKLSWVTQSEQDNRGFEIFRANENSDRFERIASFNDATELRGAGSTSSASSYNYFDRDIEMGTIYRYKLADVDIAGNRTMHSTVLTVVATENSLDLSKGAGTPNSYKLESNYPNPFNPSTTIGFALKEAGQVELVVFNALGQKVETLISGYMEAGSYTKMWQATNQPAGVYYYRITTKGFVETKKMILLK